MSRQYRIVNLKTKTYIDVESTPTLFDGEWYNNFDHTRKADWSDVQAYCLWEHDQKEGLFYVYDLCRDGGIFTLLADIDKNPPEQIDRAKNKLYRDQDVVSLTVLKLKDASHV